MKYPVLAVLLLAATTAAAVTNSDAPAHVDAFEKRMAPYQERIRSGKTTLAMDRAMREMAEALDEELNSAYEKLMQRLPDTQRSALRASQRRWLAYRDAEFAFLSGAFTRESHGSSSVLTVGQARNALVRARVETLLSYLEAL